MTATMKEKSQGTFEYGTKYDYSYQIGDEVIGHATVLEYEDGKVQLDRIDISAEHRGQGHGSDFIAELGGVHGDMYCAPDSKASKRLYERIGEEFIDHRGDDEMSYIDQGYGVYIV